MIRFTTPRTSRNHTHIAGVALIVVALLGGCSDSGDEPSDEETTSMKYCQIIDRESITAIVGDLDVTASGGPTTKSGGRMVQCSIVAPELGAQGRILTVETRELGAPELAAPESDRFDSALAKARDAQEFTQLDPGQGAGFASFDGQDASARLLTDNRLVFATAPVTPDQASTVTPRLLALVQEVDANLDVWDAQNPAE